MGDDVNYRQMHNDLLVLAGMHRRDFALLDAQAKALAVKEDPHGIRVDERAAFHDHTANVLADAAAAINALTTGGV